MCGIAGILEFSKSHADVHLAATMNQTLSHRGPDGGDVVVQGAMALAHRRLAIIDLSDAGKQPMGDESGTLWITFNGEIYNHKALRQILSDMGYGFRSHCDTEVILYAYAAWGKECLHRLHGMFAFALWDMKNQQLWLARDRLGIKPLFFAKLVDSFVFASEIKALLVHPDLTPQLHGEGLAQFLTFNYLAAPHTLLQGVCQVQPGCHLTVDRSGKMTELSYWQIPYPVMANRPIAHWQQELDDLMCVIIKDHLVADVTCGAFLSGGVDSSGIACWMSRQSTTPVPTFTMGFADDSFDERPFARQVADHLGCDHHAFELPATTADILPKLVYHADEPTADASLLAVYLLAQATKNHVKVVLCGDGADELFAGYETHTAWYARHLFRWLPAPLRRLLGRVLTPSPTENKVGWDEKWQRFLHGAELSAYRAHASWRIIHTDEDRQSLLSPDLPASCHMDAIGLYARYLEECPSHHPVNAMLYADTRFYLPNDMLVKVDRATMAHGLEARVPFLDHRLVEFAARVPPSLKLHHFTNKKYLLKTTLSRYLPPSILKRPKAGFNIPNKRWLRHEWRPFVMDHLSKARLQNMGWLRPNTVESLLQDHFSGRIDASHKIWGLLVLALWYDRVFGNNRNHGG